MLEFLAQIDRSLFLFINHTLANPVTDFIMPYITSGMGLKILYGIAMVLVLALGNARLRWMVLFSLVVVLLTDQISANFLKDVFGRMRPCHSLDPSQINLLVGCGGGKSMPSAHAANAFGQAVFWGWANKKIGIYLYLYAALVALSRVFVGVHYPFDILVGAIIGFTIGLSVILIFNIFQNSFPGVKRAL